MALTLLESLKHFTTLPEDVQPLIIEKYAGSSDILMNLPFVDAPSGTYAYRNRSQYPSVGFRAIGGSYAQTNGVINLQKESVFDLGGNIILDAFIADLQNGMGLDALTNEAEATATAAGLHWTAKFFKGDSRTGVEFDGLQNRLSGDRVLHTDNGSGSHTSGGDAISFKTLRIAKSLVLNPSCWIMSRQMKLKIDDAATNPDVAGYLTISPGQLGLEANMLMGLPIYTVDLDDAGNEILPFQEAAAGGGSGCNLTGAGAGLPSISVCL